MASEGGGLRVCVIIPSLRNSEELAIVLQGLSNQTWPNAEASAVGASFEVVVVGPSDDPGQAVAEANGARFIDDEGSRTRADACNVALREVECDIVLFTDDDVWVEPDWVERLIPWFEREEVAG